MLVFFKKHVNYVSEHAVDPDMRRYATKYEAMRHYIDIDHWDTLPFKKIPRDFDVAMIKYGKMYFQKVDLSLVPISVDLDYRRDSILLKVGKDIIYAKKRDFLNFVKQDFLSKMYEGEIKASTLQLNYWLKSAKFDANEVPFIILEDGFTDYGILPYYLEMGLGKLTAAFKNKNKNDILRHAADLGHYIGDAHVPLHTTTNYNGQLTDQLGIHAFWESRLPELFAEKEYDFFVGKAEYITNIQDKIWEIIADTHRKKFIVLSVEKELSKTFPPDKQWCFDNRLDITVRIQCKEYSDAYHKALKGMVEEQMTKTIKSLGDFWYTAWVDAGSPNLKDVKDEKYLEEKIIKDPNIKTREHNN
jgi:hypothetical protein